MDYSRLDTEKINPRTLRIDTFSIPRILEAMSREDAEAVNAVKRQKNSIAKGAALIAQALGGGHRLFFAGAGTSGRLGIMEAAECPPTFQTSPSQIQAIMAGGKAAVFQSQEGAEDNGAAARRMIAKKTRSGDVVAGVAASGVTPFVLSALKTAKSRGCRTILVTCNPNWKKETRGFAPDAVIALKTGPEVIAGSTRLKAGSATKMALNMLTTASLIRLGKTYGNRMVDLQMKSKKLRERAVRIVIELAGVSRQEALLQLQEARGSAKTAILMARKKIGYAQAGKLLRRRQGFLRSALEN